MGFDFAQPFFLPLFLFWIPLRGTFLKKAAKKKLELVWAEQFPDTYQAIAAERQIKKWSHKKKEALIRGDFNLVLELAQSPEMRDRRKARKKKS